MSAQERGRRGAEARWNKARGGEEQEEEEEVYGETGQGYGQGYGQGQEQGQYQTQGPGQGQGHEPMSPQEKGKKGMLHGMSPHDRGVRGAQARWGKKQPQQGEGAEEYEEGAKQRGG